MVFPSSFNINAFFLNSLYLKDFAFPPREQAPFAFARSAFLDCHSLKPAYENLFQQYLAILFAIAFTSLYGMVFQILDLMLLYALKQLFPTLNYYDGESSL